MQKSISHVALRGVAACVPTKEIENLTFPYYSSEEARKAVDSTGVFTRRVTKNHCASDLCFTAAKKLFEKISCDPLSIDVLIFVSQTPDYVLPATACVLQQRLGLGAHVMAFDINLGCSGYTYGLIVLAQMLSSGFFKKGLLLAGDTVSKLVSEQDRSVAFLFGDAGSATLLEFDPSAEPLYFDNGTDGAGYDKLIVEAGGFRYRPDKEAQTRAICAAGHRRAKTELFMSGTDIFSFTLKEVPKTIACVLETAAWSKEMVSLFVFHQANEFMLKHLIKKMALDSTKVPMSLSTYGNTSVASIPLTLCQMTSFDWSKENKLLLVGFGVGFSWASVACITKNLTVLPVIELEEAESE